MESRFGRIAARWSWVRSTPEDFGGMGNGDQQEAHERGNLSVCAGCVRAVGCEGLVE